MTNKVSMEILFSCSLESEVVTSISLMTEPMAAVPRHNNKLLKVCGCVTQMAAAVPTDRCVFPVICTPILRTDVGRPSFFFMLFKLVRFVSPFRYSFLQGCKERKRSVFQKGIAYEEEQHQMYRVKEVEKVFDLPAPLSVIHVDRDKSQAGGCFPQQREAAGNGPFQGIALEQIQYDNENDAFITVICL